MTEPFHDEGPRYYDQAYQRYRQFAVQSDTNYQTRLTASQEQAFKGWVQQYGIPFDVNADIVDYDMRGYWLSTGGKVPERGERGGQYAFDDTWKTPYDTTFSNESIYATPDNPYVWKDDQTLIDKRTGAPSFQELPRFQAEPTAGGQSYYDDPGHPGYANPPGPGSTAGVPGRLPDQHSIPRIPPEIHRRPGGVQQVDNDTFAPGDHGRPYAPDVIPKREMPDRGPGPTDSGRSGGLFDDPDAGERPIIGQPPQYGAPHDRSQQPQPWYLYPDQHVGSAVEQAGNHFEAGHAEGRRVAPQVREHMLNAIDNRLMEMLVEGLRGHGISL